MLARRDLPQAYIDWNRRWAAPFGSGWTRRIRRRWWTWPIAASLVGPFAFQGNNDTRIFEYPWAFGALQVRPGLSVLEIGGSLSGFQFVLDRAGCRVVNVDPATEAEAYWPLDRPTFELLNRRFGTQVTLKQCMLHEADLLSNHFDRVVSISVIEHIPPEDLRVLLEHVRRILKPGGLFVLTVDLFLDLHPFSALAHNHFGTNISIERLVRDSGLIRIAGEPRELYGFAEFNAGKLLATKENYYVGQGWPTMVQTLILAKDH
jgi:SAM-dependent methyltransferase